MPDAPTQVKLNVFYPQPPHKVWRALTDRKILARWLMPNDFEPRRGHRFRFQPRTRRDGPEPIHCEVVEIESPRRLVYTWRPASSATSSQMTWTLDPVEGGTRLTLMHSADLHSVTDAIADVPTAPDASAAFAWTERTTTLRMQITMGRFEARRVPQHNRRKIVMGRVAV